MDLTAGEEGGSGMRQPGSAAPQAQPPRGTVRPAGGGRALLDALAAALLCEEPFPRPASSLEGALAAAAAPAGLPALQRQEAAVAADAAEYVRLCAEADQRQAAAVDASEYTRLCAEGREAAADAEYEALCVEAERSKESALCTTAAALEAALKLHTELERAQPAKADHIQWELEQVGWVGVGCAAAPVATPGPATTAGTHGVVSWGGLAQPAAWPALQLRRQHRGALPTPQLVHQENTTVFRQLQLKRQQKEMSERQRHLQRTLRHEQQKQEQGLTPGTVLAGLERHEQV